MADLEIGAPVYVYNGRRFDGKGRFDGVGVVRELYMDDKVRITFDGDWSHYTYDVTELVPLSLLERLAWEAARPEWFV